MAALHRVRIFLASPKDTAAAREVVARVVDGINDNPLLSERVQIDLLRWDDPQHPVPCSFLRNPQHDVVASTGDPGHCDLVIALFRHTFGSPLPIDDFGHSPNGDAWTGTEWELHRAVEAAKRGEVREILVFRDLDIFQIHPDASIDEDDQAYAQYARVKAFFDACKKPGTHEILRGINEHHGLSDFEAGFTRRLNKWLTHECQRRDALTAAPVPPAAAPPPPASAGHVPLNSAQQRLSDILLDHDQPLDDELIESAWQADVQDLRSYALRRFAAWCRPGHGELDTRFVNLDLLAYRPEGAAGETWATRNRYPSLQALFAARPQAGAWVLVGDPGGGKSTLLQHHELQTQRALLRALDAGDPLPELCVWQRLADCPHDTPDPQAWLDAQWQLLYPALAPLKTLARNLRLRYLLDGVNEIQAPDAAAYRKAVRRWAGWAAGLTQAAGHHAPPLFSVRTLEFSEPLSSATLQVEQARLAHWQPSQMRQYCVLRLGPANALWQRLDEDARLKDLCALPFNLAAQCDLTLALGRPAQDRAELFGGLAWLRLRRAFERDELDGDGLLSPRDRRQLIDADHWRSHLTDLPEEGSLLAGLARQAEAMHRSGQGTEVGVPAQAVAPWIGTPAERSAWLKATAALNLTEVELNGRFRYTHQLWQEYFAARAVRNLPADPTGAWPDLSPPALEDMNQALARLAAKDPLPGPDVCGWEEAIKLAVQLSDDPAAWLTRLQAINLPLAGRSALAVKAKLQGSATGNQALQALRQALLDRSRDPATDLRRRIEAAEALGLLGDPRYREGIGPGGARFLWPIAEQWIKVPAGRHVVGSDTPERLDEGPATAVPVAAFEMAFAPVTNAEFACFIDAKGYEDAQWWDPGLARQWLEKGLRNDAEIEYWRPRLAALRQDFDAAIQAYFSGETQAYVDEQLRTYAGWTEAEAEARLESSFGANAATQPAHWDDARFNQPLQPVVGISLFEARAYAHWLTVQTGKPLRLPTEAEWDAAARGHGGRRWPWGMHDPTALQLNADPAHLRRTSPVGVFPNADTTPGLTDMPGNVWEWTISLYTDRLDAQALTSDVVDGDARRAVRGGSWRYLSTICRASYRDRLTPGDRNLILGFRVVCCPIQEP
ncbi:SUMF1/EgtB/PvdO family nonheme iron enzyme [Ideonella sp. A 288]|uniref:SUMF1/EgtB/PvdO family nonheme iron enzyme n=1 Tax=Ideonella sp. A 288 TaxID=1962181 RepID=UPI0011852CC0|nr:SUMF1/EgtB/PvdO family nonheme iron enzyme [Ideonella sp. A 288]